MLSRMKSTNRKSFSLGIWAFVLLRGGRLNVEVVDSLREWFLHVKTVTIFRLSVGGPAPLLTALMLIGFTTATERTVRWRRRCWGSHLTAREIEIVGHFSSLNETKFEWIARFLFRDFLLSLAEGRLSICYVDKPLTCLLSLTSTFPVSVLFPTKDSTFFKLYFFIKSF